MSFRTIKPAQLSLLFRTVERSRRIYGCFSVLTMHETVDGLPHLRTEASLWQTLAARAPDFTEASVAKSQPEYLVFGHAYGYDGQAEGVAGVRFAGRTKWLRVFGARRHPDAMQPAPLGKVPLHWRHAWGGPGFAANPLGTGCEPDADGGIVLPHFERPDAPWQKDRANAQPAGFGPLAVEHPERARCVGTYDEAWLKSDFPGMASDADWRFFQIAPPDQRFASDLNGDESYSFIGLHPAERRQDGRLPGMGPRVFIERHQRPGLKEIECKLRTVVFLPDAGAVVQVWQGAVPLGDEDGGELRHVLAGLEPLTRRRTPADYAAVLASRLDEEDGLLAMLHDEDLLPEGIGFEAIIPSDIDLNKQPAADSLAGRLEKKHYARVEAVRAEVAAHGLDPDHHAPPLPGPREQLPPLRELGRYFRELDQRAKQQREHAAELQRRSLEQHRADFAARGESFDYVLEELKTTRTGPPKARAPDLLELLQHTRADLGSQPGFSEIDEMLSDTALHQRWREQDEAAQRMYERSAHFQTAAPRSSGRFAERQRRWITERLAAHEPLKGFDLSGADLRGFDLRGAVLDGAMLEGACLEGVDLTGATANGAVLAHAVLTNARADGASFVDANLGRADFSGASLRSADFTRAVLWETQFAGAVLRAACLRDAECLHIRLAGADLSEAVLDELLLYQTDLTQTRFSRASLAGASLLENKLDATDFTAVRAHAAVFLQPRGVGIRFDGADLTRVAFVQKPALPRASMRGATLTKTFAHGADFRGADFSQATLDDAEFGHADLRSASLRGARARNAGLRFVDFGQANVSGADLRGALLGNSKLHGARLEATSFFMADLARIQIDTATRFEHANLGRARLYPRWEPPRS